MKKLRCMLFILGFILLMMPTTFAGDVPEALGYEDTAKVFIGTLCDFKNTDENHHTDVDVIPTFKIKGDVEIGELKTYSICYFGRVSPQKDKEYLFGWFRDDSVYAYEVESHNEETIKIKTTDAFAERIQNYLDDGYYEHLEQKRVNLGRKITFTEFLDVTKDSAQSVTINFDGNQYEVDKEEFFKVSDSIVITDVKDTYMIHEDEEGLFYNMIFISVKKNQANESPYYSDVAVSKLGEVDRYSLTMSRLPGCDFQMEKKDIQKLYKLLPKDAVKEVLEEDKAENTKNFITMILAVVILIIVISVVIIYIRRKIHK